MAAMSSAVRGLIPKSTGGRMALAGGGALAVAGGVTNFRNKRRKEQRYDALRQRVINSVQLTEVTPQGQPIRTYGPGNMGMREL